LRRSVALLCLFLSSFSSAPAGADSVRERQAVGLVTAARLLLAQDTFDTRRSAMLKLEDATLIAPGHADWELLLARTYMRSGYLGLARHRFERVKSFAPDDADARFGLAQTWRYDWLKYLEADSRDQAIEHFRAAARLAPRRPDAWIMLVPLLVDRGDVTGAADASHAAIEADPNRIDAMIADAYMSFRTGRVERSDSLFTRAIPRLPRAVRDRFEDIHPIASERDTVAMRHLWPHQLAAFERRFWREQDPDFSTPENEAQLEYWSRVAHAYLLYYDARRQTWDQRGEIYVRYGAPARQIYNGVGDTLTLGLTPGSHQPVNVLVWEYPELGMRVKMQDRMLNGFYLPDLEIGLIDNHVVEAGPDPDSLARRAELLGIGDGRGVFPRVPPGTKLLPVDGAVARFTGEKGPRILAGFESPGSPADSLVAVWVVRDSNDVEVTRATRPLGPSACDATGAEVADFANDLPPGRYTVGYAVRGARHLRGNFREEIDLDADPGTLAVSDLVVSCGVPDAATFDPRNPSVRVEPNPSSRVRSGEPLTAYFEINHLRADADGVARFEFSYTVRSLERDKRVWLQRLFAPHPLPNPIHTSRSEQQIGEIRRQFVSIPLQNLPAGHYRLEISVRDLVSGEAGGVATDFLYGAPAVTGSLVPSDAPAGGGGR